MPELFKDHIGVMGKFLDAIENEQNKLPRSHLDILKNALSLIKDYNPMDAIYCMGHATGDFYCKNCLHNCGDFDNHTDTFNHKDNCDYILTIRDLEAWIRAEEGAGNSI